MGIAYILAGVFFLFNPNINVVDVLPDFIGYLLIYRGLFHASFLSDNLRQARDLITMIDILFDHPQVEAFTNWDFTDGAWLGAPAGLVRKDGSRKPSFEALKQRVRGDWHTSLDLMTDENGCIKVEGFRGLYTLVCDGMETTFALKKDCPAQEITLG